MRRKAVAMLSVFALATCIGRVSAWAATPGDAHACCRGESSTPTKDPVLSECCAVPAVGGRVSVIRAELLAILAETPAASPVPTVHSAVIEEPAPPGPDAFRSAVPARAPPLA